MVWLSSFLGYDAMSTDMFIEISEDIAASFLKGFSIGFTEDEGTKHHQNICSYQVTWHHG